MLNQRLFASLSLAPGEALTPAEAGAASWHVVATFDGDRPLSAVVMNRDRPDRAVYFGRSWPDDALLAAHRASYGDLPLTLIAPKLQGPDGILEDSWTLGRDGALSRARLMLSGDERVLAEHRLDEAGAIIWSTIYSYGPDGELASVSEVTPEGRVVSTHEAD